MFKNNSVATCLITFIGFISKKRPVKKDVFIQKGIGIIFLAALLV